MAIDLEPISFGTTNDIVRIRYRSTKPMIHDSFSSSSGTAQIAPLRPKTCLSWASVSVIDPGTVVLSDGLELCD